MKAYKKVVRCLVLASLLFGGLACGSDYQGKSDVPSLSQLPQHSTSSQRIVSRFLRSHYQPFVLDDAFSAKIFDRYISYLDSNREILLLSDIQKIENKKYFLDDELKSGNLETAYQLYNLAQQRRYERYRYALSLLNQPFSFEQVEWYDYDHSKQNWVATQDELNHLWYLRLKAEALNLKLEGKEWTEIQSTLSKRYNRAIKNLLMVNSEDVFDLFINSFISLLDPHSAYLTPRSNKMFNTQMSLSLEGIGATLRAVDDYVEIEGFIPGGPADKSKQLSIGDRIIGVGQGDKPIVDVVGWPLDEVVNLILGPKGTQVRLSIQPSGVNQPTKIIILTRDKIALEEMRVKKTIKSVNGQKVAVLTVPSFYDGLTVDSIKILQELSYENVQGVIVDLRKNFGGKLKEAIEFSGLFIETGPIVQVRSSNKAIRVDYDIDSKIYYSGPLVVLVNRLSVSASEIFAAVIQDYHRGLIVGETTYGKGTVQQQSDLTRVYDQVFYKEKPSLGAVLFTNEKFYRITGESTQLKGVTPDIMMPSEQVSTETGEVFTENPLPWDKISPVNFTSWQNLTRFIVPLTSAHEKRVTKEPEFIYLIDDIKEYQQDKEKYKRISLNYQQRKTEFEKEEAKRLQRMNERLARVGKPAIEALSELPKDYQKPDIYLDETVLITLDLAKLLNQSSNDNQ